MGMKARAEQLALLELPTLVRPHLRPVTVATPQPVAQSVSRRRQVWLALHLRDWSLHAAIRSLGTEERAELLRKPIAVVEDDQRKTILSCNSIASNVGIRAGHSLNAAIALCADISFVPRRTESEAEHLGKLAELCDQFSPSVSLAPPDELLIEVRGSFKLFGGVAALIEKIRQAFVNEGLDIQIALAPTPYSAQWLSRSACSPVIARPRDLIPSIARLSVGHLRWPAKLELRLARFGILSIGDLLRLPRGSLARRIGYERLEELDRATGRHPEVRQMYRRMCGYSDRILLDFEIETTSLLSVVIEKRMERLALFLRKRELAVRLLELVLRHREKAPTVVTIGLAHPSSDVNHLIGLMHEHLDRLQLVSPVTEVVVRVQRPELASPRSNALFRGSHAEGIDAHDGQAKLLEQLQARLGKDALLEILPSADYRPDAAQRMGAATVDELHQFPSLPSSLARRPLWLLDSPVQITSTAQSVARLKVISEPEYIESGWWDQHAVDREYCHACVKRSRAWIFRHLSRPNEWYVHGLFG